MSNCRFLSISSFILARSMFLVPLLGLTQEQTDFTGYWVSVVSEDWRWRMVVPARGDYANIPISVEGRRVADLWNPGNIRPDEACRPYGAAGIMRVPGRLRITWEDESTLRIDTDAGMQTRRFHLNGQIPSEIEPTLQGYSVAQWATPPGGTSAGSGLGAVTGRAAVIAQSRTLEVRTAHMLPAYLRWNGVPYSADAALDEYYDLIERPNGDTWFVVTTVVDDPLYLDEPYVTSANFKKEPDDSKWNPVPCLEE